MLCVSSFGGSPATKSSILRHPDSLKKPSLDFQGLVMRKSFNEKVYGRTGRIYTISSLDSNTRQHTGNGLPLTLFWIGGG